MTDEANAPKPVDPITAFWDRRTAHKAKVADALDAVVEAVEEGRKAGLYADGLTTLLNQVKVGSERMSKQLREPAASLADAGPEA